MQDKFKNVLNIYDRSVWTEFIYFLIVSAAGFYKQGIESSGFIESENFLIC
jgi:hypothetical protein